MRKSLPLFTSWVFTFLALGLALKPGFAQSHSTAEVCALCVRADLNFLASNELQGRGSGTRDEHLAALYAASLFAGFGLEPGGDKGTFLQKAPLPSPLPPNIAGRL